MRPLTPRQQLCALAAWRRLLRALVALLLFAALPAMPPAANVHAATRTVTTCASNGPGSLPIVFAAATAGDTITFTADCTDTNAITLTGSLTAVVNVTIDATAPPHMVTISGGSSVQLFLVKRDVTLSLHGLTLANGASSSGGAIFNAGTVDVIDSTFSGNSTSNGGGAISNGGMLNVVDSTFSGNSTSKGGGGAIDCFSGTVNVASSTFSGNTANFGGAISNNATVNVINSTFSANSTARGGFGGAISNLTDATLVVIGSTFSGNASGLSGFGGAIYNNGATVRLALSVVAGNSASAGGPDIFGAVTTDGGGNVVGTTSGSHGIAASSNKLKQAPLLAPLAGNGGPVQTFALLPGSPAIAIAPCPTDPVTTLPLGTDARGVSRPQGTNCDAGSYQSVARP